MKLIFRL